MTFGPQKGADTPALLAELEAGMQNYARVLRCTFPEKNAEFPEMCIRDSDCSAALAAAFYGKTF